MLTSADFQKLHTATLALYAPPLDAGNWQEHAFDFLAALVTCDLLNFGCLNPRTGVATATTLWDGPDWEQAAAGYARCMDGYACYRLDPAVNGGRPFFRSDFMTARQLRNLDIYAECFRLLGTTESAAIQVPLADGCLGWFWADRDGRKSFTERDRALLALAQPHLVNSHRLACAGPARRDAQPLDAATFASSGLTPRESEVACWLTEGKSNAEIATLLHLHVQSVKAHVTALFNKTGTGNRLALTLHLLDLARAASRHELRRCSSVNAPA